jgi:hypothetical protein
MTTRRLAAILAADVVGLLVNDEGRGREPLLERLRIGPPRARTPDRVRCLMQPLQGAAR